MTREQNAGTPAFPVVALALGAAAFVAFGLALLAAPELLALVDIAAPTPTARSDLRAVYGGMELGVGALLALCARRAAWRRGGLTAQALALGGVAAGRLVSLAADGLPRPLTLALWGAELSGALLALAALRTLDGRGAPGAPGASHAPGARDARR